MFDWDKINLELDRLGSNSTFQEFVENFRSASTVGYVAHGGNLAIADHAAIDATRHTEKMCYAPGSGIVTTSLFNEYNHLWQREWIAKTNLDCYLIITCTGTSDSIHQAVDWLQLSNKSYCVITARSQDWNNEVVLNLNTYHEFECAALASTYILLQQAGYECPQIK